MDTWTPRATVACVVERQGRYLMVEERDKVSGALVFNQPAGHLQAGETLTAAARRETAEETGWTVELLGLVGVALYTAPATGITYLRTTFAARPVQELANAVIDPDIHRVHWLDYESILARSGRLRSPLVLASLERYRLGACYPLDLIFQPSATPTREH